MLTLLIFYSSFLLQLPRKTSSSLSLSLFTNVRLWSSLEGVSMMVIKGCFWKVIVDERNRCQLLASLTARLIRFHLLLRGSVGETQRYCQYTNIRAQWQWLSVPEFLSLLPQSSCRCDFHRCLQYPFHDAVTPVIL